MFFYIYFFKIILMYIEICIFYKIKLDFIQKTLGINDKDLKI